jgi:hypothetical protein
LVSIRQDKLLEGRTKSCGYKKDLQKTRSKRETNRFEIKDDYVVGYTYDGEKFYFDKDDYELVTSVSMSWSFNDSGYLGARDMRDGIGRYPDGRRKFVRLKDIVMRKQSGERVEYIDKSARHDNRKSNLIRK